MKPIKLAAAVLNQTPLDWAGNRANIEAAISDARAAGAVVLCLPELAITGYGCEDAFAGTFVTDTAAKVLHELRPLTTGMAVAVGLPVRFHRGVYNAVALLVDGQILGLVAKRFLAGDGIHYEPRWFKAWPANLEHVIELEGNRYPIGDLVFDVGGIRIGFEICEDAWVADRPGASLSKREVDVILNPSASHFAFGKIEVRERFVLEGSRSFGAAYVYANLLGNEAGRAIYDGGALIASSGRLVARGPRFSFRDCVVTTAVVDLDLLRTDRARTVSHHPDLVDVDRGRIAVATKLPWAVWVSPESGKDAWEKAEGLKEEEFSRAVALALFDYLRKSRSRGFVISLSGGADSAAVAALCSLALRFALDEIGTTGVAGKLPYLDVQGGESAADLTRRLVTCVYQATQHSSTTTRNAAREIAASLNADFKEFDVEALVAGYVDMVGAALGRTLSWEHDDIALQNIQARVRAPGVWMIANIRGALLLSTSNRSEAAVGYATMDGDTAGGLSPIAGIDKAFLRRWLAWIETEGPVGIGAMRAMHSINRQAPTAELRPSDQNQTDENDLMPYPVLDAVERWAIRDKRSPLEAFQLLQEKFPEHEPELLRDWIVKFFQLWCRNQWKRERYAPSFHLDDENLDPKTWCRFPILSGGFEHELKALRALAID